MRQAGAAVVAAALLALTGAGAFDALRGWVGATALPPLAPATGTEVLDRDGRLLRAYQVSDGRWRLAPGAVDPLYPAMLLAWEDRRFHRHGGIDARALVRAGWQALGHGRVVSGGSTLSMQVARLLEGGGTGRWAGKLRQMRVALALERQLAKDNILALYLLLAPFGSNIEGVRAASLAWFGKPPARLTPAEAALLVALPQSPAARRPDRHPEAARAARDRVLARAAVLGVITEEAARAAMSVPVPRTQQPFPALAPHLADRLTAVAPPGARIATTLDAGLQARAEALAAEAAAAQGARLSAAMLVLDHRDGAVRATVGSAGYGDAARQGFVDMTRAARSPGSALKPLIYAMAFDAGIAHPETLIDDRPTDFGGYAPRNFDRAHQGTVRLRQALQASLNVPAVALLERLGPARLMASLRRAGAEPRLAGTPGLALALGGLGLTLEEVTALHAALARGGVALTPAYREEDRAEGPRLVSPRAAWYVADILAGQPAPGGGPARFAWKTGTSYGYRDAWAFGFDGRHAAGVWLGRPDGTPVPGALAAATAAPLLERLFAALGPPVPLPPPPADALTGAAPAPLATFRRPGDAQQGGPEIAFPPDGARLSPEGGRLALRLRGGIPPFTILANGRPVATGLRWPWADLAAVGPGFLDLAVIDAAGRAARARVELR